MSLSLCTVFGAIGSLALSSNSHRVFAVAVDPASTIITRIIIGDGEPNNPALVKTNTYTAPPGTTITPENVPNLLAPSGYFLAQPATVGGAIVLVGDNPINTAYRATGAFPDDTDVTPYTNTATVKIYRSRQAAQVRTVNDPRPDLVPPGSAYAPQVSRSGMPLTLNITDTTLFRQGYSYQVTGPDGRTYPTLAAANAATTTFDFSNNGNRSVTAIAPNGDEQIQFFTVTYTPIRENPPVRDVPPISDVPPSMPNTGHQGSGDNESAALSAFFTLAISSVIALVGGVLILIWRTKH
jgi:hypothetical protein